MMHSSEARAGKFMHLQKYVRLQVRIRPPSLYSLWHPTDPAPELNLRASKLVGAEVSLHIHGTLMCHSGLESAAA